MSSCVGFVCLEWRRKGVQSILGDGGAFVVGGTNPEVGVAGSVGRIGVEPWSRLSKFCFLVGV